MQQHQNDSCSCLFLHSVLLLIWLNVWLNLQSVFKSQTAVGVQTFTLSQQWRWAKCVSGTNWERTENHVDSRRMSPGGFLHLFEECAVIWYVFPLCVCTYTCEHLCMCLHAQITAMSLPVVYSCLLVSPDTYWNHSTEKYLNTKFMNFN